jgi:hypothetical protein
MNWPFTNFHPSPSSPSPSKSNFFVSAFIDFFHELIERAENQGVKIEPLSPEEVERFIR